ncbi:MAG TPA: hypothetical protein VGF89_00870 [Steroidobacteraceae bacterium]
MVWPDKPCRYFSSAAALALGEPPDPEELPLLLELEPLLEELLELLELPPLDDDELLELEELLELTALQGGSVTLGGAAERTHTVPFDCQMPQSLAW